MTQSSVIGTPTTTGSGCSTGAGGQQPAAQHDQQVRDAGGPPAGGVPEGRVEQQTPTGGELECKFCGLPSEICMETGKPMCGWKTPPPGWRADIMLDRCRQLAAKEAYEWTREVMARCSSTPAPAPLPTGGDTCKHCDGQRRVWCPACTDDPEFIPAFSQVEREALLSTLAARRDWLRERVGAPGGVSPDGWLEELGVVRRLMERI